MSNRAIFRDNDRWCCIDQPSRVLVAWKPEEVVDVINTVEAQCEAGGLTAVGFVAYEAASAFDTALTHRPQGKLPLAYFVVGEAIEAVNLATSSTAFSLQPGITEAAFGRVIARIKDYLKAGDTYQVNFTHRLTGALTDPPLAVFTRLFGAQPSPYAIFLEHEQFAVCSVSPELFFTRDGTNIRCEPMKGTRPRGRFPAEDLENKEALACSDKDRAENLMIVDMVRNDLSRIASPGSVKADALFNIRRLPTVWQQVSEVTAQTDASLVDVFKALFPCASVTGAPRARTMELIRELEDTPREVYTGALGVVKPGRRVTFSVGIRTLTMQPHDQSVSRYHASYGVGGGIVWDSDPQEEWLECRAKALVLRYQLPTFELLETMLLKKDVGVCALDQHLARMRRSADYFGFSFDGAALRERLQAVQAQDDARLRLLLKRDGVATIELHPLPVTTGPVRLRLANTAVRSDNLFLFHKTTHRSVYSDARAGVSQECDDVLLWNEHGELTETTIFNLILELEGQWFTPPVEAGLLGGTHRARLIDSGRVRERRLLIADLERATKVFVCNSVRGLQPAVMLNAAADSNDG